MIVDALMWIPQVVVLLLFALGFGFFYSKRSAGKATALGTVMPGVDALPRSVGRGS